MAVLTFLATRSGIISFGGDLAESERQIIDKIGKAFADEVAAKALAERLPISSLAIRQCTYFFAARDLIQTHFHFIEAATGDTVIYADLSKHGVVHTSLIAQDLGMKVGETVFSFTIPHEVSDKETAARLAADGYVLRMVEKIRRAAAAATRPIPVTAPVAPELAAGIEAFRKDFPVGTRTAFIVMSFQKTEAHAQIVATIKTTLLKHGIVGLRADDKDYSDDLFSSVRVYMHACDFGIGVFERILQDDFNPNVSIEVGYMMGHGKNVLLLKDQTVKTLPTDLVGKLYKTFDPQRITDTMPHSIEKWLKDRDMIART